MNLGAAPAKDAIELQISASDQYPMNRISLHAPEAANLKRELQDGACR